MADTQVTIVPYFTVPEGKMEEFKAGFAACYAETKAGTKDCLYYGFAVNGNQVVCREGYRSGEAAAQHLQDVKDSVSKLVGIVGEGGVKMNLMGPAEELAKAKEAFDAFGTTYWESAPGSLGYPERLPKACADTHITIVPYFTVPEGKLEEFKSGFESFYQGVANGTTDVLYYGFCCQGNQVHCREGYKSAEAAIQHVAKDVAEPLGKAVELVGEGGVKLAVMGPAAELEKLKPTFDAVGAEYFVLDEGSFWL
mmetsp:Transcript_25810/g.47196  ORF Transcript_25810/g.47196 Transcript_25810/m.47196 type:complete len:253 (+) Transcript_25810:61-819(+)